MGNCSTYKTDKKKMNIFASFVSGYIVLGRRSGMWLYVLSILSESYLAVVVLNWKIVYACIHVLMRNFLYRPSLNTKVGTSSQGGGKDGKITCGFGFTDQS